MVEQLEPQRSHLPVEKGDEQRKLMRTWRDVDGWLANTAGFHLGYVHGALREYYKNHPNEPRMLENISFGWRWSAGRLYLRAKIEQPDLPDGPRFLLEFLRKQHHVTTNHDGIFDRNATHPHAPFIELVGEIQRTVDWRFNHPDGHAPYMECSNDGCAAILHDPDDGAPCVACG